MKTNSYRRALAQGLDAVRANPKTILAVAAATAASAGPANAQGLSAAKSTLETFKSEILGIIPIVAVIALILLALAYAFKAAEKEVLIRWGIGVIIVGAASGIVDMMLGKT